MTGLDDSFCLSVVAHEMILAYPPMNNAAWMLSSLGNKAHQQHIGPSCDDLFVSFLVLFLRFCLILYVCVKHRQCEELWMTNYFVSVTATFEDKRKENFDKGQAELERRRALLQEQMKAEENARLEKERREAEKREKIR